MQKYEEVQCDKKHKVLLKYINRDRKIRSSLYKHVLLDLSVYNT